MTIAQISLIIASVIILICFVFWSLAPFLIKNPKDGDDEGE